MSTSALAAVVSKLTGLSLAGKAVVGGLVVATAAVGAVGAAQAAAPAAPVPWSTATAEPTDDPTAEPTDEATSEPTEAPDEDSTEPTDDATEAPHTRPTDLPTAAAFGQRVAEDARDGGVDGQEISTEAKARATERQDARDTSEPQTEPTEPADAGKGDHGTGRH